MALRSDWVMASEIAICHRIITPNITEEISWQTKKEVVIEGANVQRAQMKSAIDQDLSDLNDLNELMVDMTENANPQSDNYQDDRSLLGAILDDRSVW